MWGKSERAGTFAGAPEAVSLYVKFSQLFCLIATLALTVLSFFDALEISRRLTQNSDSVLSFLRAHEVLHGNVLLSGWSVQVDNFYFTDTLPFAAAEYFIGPDPRLLAIVPALTYASFVLVALAGSLAPARPLIRNLEVAALAVLLLVSPHWFGSWDPLLFANFHLAAIAGALTALWLLVRWSDATAKLHRVERIGLPIALFFVAVATAASDPFSLVFAFGPALAVMGLDAIFRRPTGKEIAAFLVLIAGMAAGMALPGVIAWAGGFTTINFLHDRFVDASELGRNVTAVFFGLLRIVGAYPFGIRSISWASALVTIRFLGFALMAASVAGTAVDVFRGRTLPLFDRMLCASVLAVLVVCCLSAQYNAEIAVGTEWSGGAAIRYLLPVPLFAAVLAMRRVPE